MLIVRDEKTGEISVVAGLNADGTPKRTRQGGERAEFPAIRPARRRAGQLLQELLPPVQGTQPLRFLPGCGRAGRQSAGSDEGAAEEPRSLQ